jgi:hypothetical protein
LNGLQKGQYSGEDLTQKNFSFHLSYMGDVCKHDREEDLITQQSDK